MSVDRPHRTAPGHDWRADFGSLVVRRLARALALPLVVASTGAVHAEALDAATASRHGHPVQGQASILLAQSDPAQTQTTPKAPAADQPAAATETPAIVVDGDMADTLLGKSIQSANGDDMGRIVDVIVDRAGLIRAAVIDFGGFLGVGTRKIAVDWRVLNFAKSGNMETIVADLSQDQLRKAPVFKPGEPVVIIGRADAASEAPRPASPPAPPAPPPAPETAQEPPAQNR